jgi:hypothetical protein
MNTKPPKTCCDCGERLCRIEIYDTKKGVNMGHAWSCEGCNLIHVGWYDVGEYNGKPGGLTEKQSKAKQETNK